MKLLFSLLWFSHVLMVAQDLPLKEYAVLSNRDDFAIILSGDGGWHSKDINMALYFQKHQVPTVGWNSRTYFWQEKEKKTFMADLEKVIDLYAEKWQKSRVILIGYSFGADILPSTVNHLPKRYQNKVKQLVLISPGRHAQFKVTLTGLFNINSSGDPVLPELEAIHQIPVFLVCGEAKDSICRELDTQGYPHILLPGGHTFQGKLLDVAKAIGNYLQLN